MAGKRQKRPDQLADTRKQRGRKVLQLVQPAEGAKPQESSAPPLPRHAGKEFLASTREIWDRLWASPLTTAKNTPINRDTDLIQLHRWVFYLDEWLRAMRGYRRERLVKGSMGQMVLNPLGREALAFEKALQKIEEQFGGSPLTRMRLGITFGEAKKTLDDLNADLDGDDEWEVPDGFQVEIDAAPSRKRRKKA